MFLKYFPEVNVFLQNSSEYHSWISMSCFTHLAIVKCLNQNQLAIPAISLKVIENSVSFKVRTDLVLETRVHPLLPPLTFTRHNEPLTAKKKLCPDQGKAIMEYSVENHIKSYWYSGNLTLRCNGTDLIG